MKSIQIASTPLRSALWLLVFCLAAPAATLINDFTTPLDYVANGIIGDTNWDGIYLNQGDIPNNNNAGGNGPGATTVANSGVTYSLSEYSVPGHRLGGWGQRRGLRLETGAG